MQRSAHDRGVNPALVDLDLLSPAGADYADDIVQIGALQLVAARARGRLPGSRDADRVREAVLAAATLRGDRVAAPEAAKAV